MAEPTSSTATSLVVATVALLGPVWGQWAIVLLSALAGAQWALSREKSATKVEGLVLLARCLATSCVLSGTIAWILDRIYPGMSAMELLAPVAFIVAALGGRVNGVIDVVASIVLRRDVNPPSNSSQQGK